MEILSSIKSQESFKIKSWSSGREAVATKTWRPAAEVNRRWLPVAWPSSGNKLWAASYFVQRKLCELDSAERREGREAATTSDLGMRSLFGFVASRLRLTEAWPSSAAARVISSLPPFSWTQAFVFQQLWRRDILSGGFCRWNSSWATTQSCVIYFQTEEFNFRRVC